MEKQGLALFDFDGTITRGDSFGLFLKRSVSKLQLLKGFFVLLPNLVAFKTSLISNERAKQKVVKHFFRNYDYSNLCTLGEKVALNNLKFIVKDSALKQIEKHKQQGDRIVVVSASLEIWLKPWCDSMGLELIATKLETVDGRITGKFLTPNCYGPEKVRRVKELIPNYDQYSPISAYGDSRGDRELLAMADLPHYRSFS